MPEIKTPPIYGEDEYGDTTVTFTKDHTIADIYRWIRSEGWAPDLVFFLQTDRLH